ncbi:RNA polymerase sigma factor [Winogradskya humida]|uniref:RNA polymerase sigma-70 ECF-like HTH domain-containing protein n=1 Tax=Winogradskya humida TaxID=113566 RepID=A0ABQ3ZKD4_9ACTN|nr:sigma-70 family RNA polymerase sigma factor [Actinoplanes humidus]GIE18953.1 hypothetical protein Ahu01nite_020550 [Actinoplanes humidus]
MAARSGSLDNEDPFPGFAEFYQATSQGIFDLVRRAAAGDKFLAGDVMQNAYVALLPRWNSRSSLGQDTNRRYVIGIVMNKLADHYRALGRFGDTEMEDIEEAFCRPVESVASETMLFEAVRALLAQQTPRMRSVGVLIFLEGFTCAEVAGILEITSSTVRTVAERLRQRIQPIAARMTEIHSCEEGERP